VFLLRPVLLLLLLQMTGSAFAVSCDDHPWNHPLPHSLKEKQFKVITDLTKPVINKEIANAKSMLKDVPFVELTDSQASTLIGEPFHNPTAYHVFLVRGLKDNSSANLAVYRYKEKGALLLESLGMDEANKIMESPVVIYLDFNPSQVYISCQKLIL